jgi:hypothetical protein
MSRPCARPACTVTLIVDDRPLCRLDTALVPLALRDAWTAAYDRGRGLGSPALKAAEAAMVAAAEHEYATTAAGRKGPR